MSTNKDIINLSLRYFEGHATAAEASELSALLRGNPLRQQQFAEMACQHARLQEIADESALLKTELKGQIDEASAKNIKIEQHRKPSVARWLVPLATAAAVLIAVSLLFTNGGQPPQTIPQGRVALTIEKADNVVLQDASYALTSGSRISLDQLNIASGHLQFKLDSGVTVTAVGPAEITLIDPMLLEVARGKLTANVGDAKGFTINTANAKVVDLGTVFGVEADPDGGTDMVVFEGEIEVHQPDQAQARNPLLTKLFEGEAVRLDNNGQLRRIMSVSTDLHNENWAIGEKVSQYSVIASVKDNVNLKSRWSFKFYPIITAGMTEGARAWPYEVNKPRWWSQDGKSMPDWLEGADLVQTLQQELNNRNLVISLDITRPAELYVFYQKDAPTPQWLTDDFENTGVPIKLSPDPVNSMELTGIAPRYVVAFEIWKRTITEPGTVELGAVPKESIHTPPFYMYGLAAKALEQ